MCVGRNEASQERNEELVDSKNSRQPANDKSEKQPTCFFFRRRKTRKASKSY